MSSVFPILLLLLLPIVQTSANINLGSSLSAGDVNSSWLSPSHDFAFGFHGPDKNDLFLLAIWFDKIPDKTIVWCAKRDDNLDPVQPVPKGSKVELTNDGRFVLNDPQRGEIWQARPADGRVNHASMLDTGNFVLSTTNSSAAYLWESFKKPIDTLLPTQILESNGMLSSRQMETNYSRGRFQLRLLDDGNLVLNTIALPTNFAYDAYYISNTYNSGYQVVFNDSGHIYILRRNESIFKLSPEKIKPITEVYYRATLDFDGVFTLYSHPRLISSRNESWSIEWSIPDDICFNIRGIKGSGACGYNSYCVLTEERRPYCECPPGYSFLDQSNRLSGCKPDFVQGCLKDESRSPEDIFDMKVLWNTDWPESDYEKFQPTNEDECKNSCLYDCNCGVAILRGETCWKKKLPLSNGRQRLSVNGKALIKVRKQNPYLPADTKKKDQSTLVLVGSLLLGSSIFINFLLLTAISQLIFLKYHKKLRKIHQGLTVFETNLRSFTYRDLEEATDGFKEELGRGAFGNVYKGVLAIGSKAFVAVKKLDKVVQEGEKEFKTEVSIIGQTHHKNLVRLIGYCDEGTHRLLVYEFMSNGSLASFLFGISRPDWNKRTQIAFGIARGLMYLHEECSSQIVHCDIKPQNILLDDCFTARISDFGLAKLLMNDQTKTRTGIRGTRGYVAPEWFRNMPITVKVDVYSFGVMLLEIICCRKSVELELGGEERAILTDWAYDCYREGKLHDLVVDDEDAMNDMKRVERLVMIAIWCIQEEPSLRPPMKKIIQMLEGVVEVSHPPCPYPFSRSVSLH